MGCVISGNKYFKFYQRTKTLIIGCYIYYFYNNSCLLNLYGMRNINCEMTMCSEFFAKHSEFFAKHINFRILTNLDQYFFWYIENSENL